MKKLLDPDPPSKGEFCKNLYAKLLTKKLPTFSAYPPPSHARNESLGGGGELRIPYKDMKRLLLVHILEFTMAEAGHFEDGDDIDR